MHRRLSPLQTGVIRTLPLQKEPRPFKALPLALRTRQLAGCRSLVMQRAASIPLPARDRSFSTLQTPIRRLGQRRFYLTPPVQTTQPLERPLFYTIPSASTTPPSVIKLSLA